jgi:hypothetical protein
LLLSIKAKMESVETGITTFDSEFFPHFVLPSGMTIAETILPQLPDVISGNTQLALPAPPN